jgi:GT2 family glycosyltransferase
MDLSVIIVNWNSKDYLRKCIKSIISTTFGIEYEILVIDSGSFDGCRDMLSHFYPQVRFIQSAKNIGFAKANNAAFLESTGRNLLFLNPDTEVEGNALQTLLHCLESIKDAGVVGAMLLNTDRSIQTTCIRAFPTIINQLFESGILRKALPNSCLYGMAPINRRSSIPSEVQALSGACMMIKRSVFEAVGMFDPEYFMYSEDIDLCFQVKMGGWKVYYIPSAVVIHHGGGCSQQKGFNAFSSVMMQESRLHFFRKNRSSLYGDAYRLSILVISLMRIFLLLCATQTISARKKGLLLYHSLKKWKTIFRWTIGQERWVKNYRDTQSL